MALSLLSTRGTRRLLQRTRSLSTRASQILSSLDITPGTVVSGVYDGQWSGSGEILQSRCPTSGEVLAEVASVSPSPAFPSQFKANCVYFWS